MEQKPFFSIIITSFNSGAFLRNCLQSIYQSDFHNFEVVLVDNASIDDSFAKISQKILSRPNLKLVRIKKNIGSVGGRITGIKKNRGKYLFFLDADTVVEKNCLESLAKFLRQHPEVGAVHPKLLNLEKRQYFDYAGDYLDPFGFLVNRAKGEKDYGQFDDIVPILSSKTAAAAVKKEAYEKIGGFDKDYFFYLEDTDLDWRLWLADYPVLFFPKAVVYHGFNTTEKNKNKGKYYSEKEIKYFGPRNYLLTLLKNLGAKKTIKIIPLHIFFWLLTAFFFLIKGKYKDSFYIIKGILWNFFHLPKVLRKRAVIQKNRSLSDEDLEFLFKRKEPLNFYLKRLFSYIS